MITSDTALPRAPPPGTLAMFEYDVSQLKTVSPSAVPLRHMANHCLRGQPLPKSGGGLARGTRDNLNLAIGRGDLDAVKRFL